MRKSESINGQCTEGYFKKMLQQSVPEAIVSPVGSRTAEVCVVEIIS